MLKRNEDKIRKTFARLVRQVLAILKSQTVDMEELRVFISNIFPGILQQISPLAEVSEIFLFISENQLWSYTDYSLLQSIAEEFATEAQPLIETYELELSGYYATTSLVDYLSLCKINEEDEEAATTYDRSYFRKLSVKLSVPVSDKTLQYIRDLWKAIARTFLLPSLTAILHAVITGSLVVVWYISHPVAIKIVQKFGVEAQEFFRDHHILEVKIDGEVVYQCTKEENLKVKYEVAKSYNCFYAELLNFIAVQSTISV